MTESIGRLNLTYAPLVLNNKVDEVGNEQLCIYANMYARSAEAIELQELVDM